MQLAMLYLRMQVHPCCGEYPHTAKIAQYCCHLEMPPTINARVVGLPPHSHFVRCQRRMESTDDKTSASEARWTYIWACISETGWWMAPQATVGRGVSH